MQWHILALQLWIFEAFNVRMWTGREPDVENAFDDVQFSVQLNGWTEPKVQFSIHIFCCWTGLNRTCASLGKWRATGLKKNTIRDAQLQVKQFSSTRYKSQMSSWNSSKGLWSCVATFCRDASNWPLKKKRTPSNLSIIKIRLEVLFLRQKQAFLQEG